MLHGLVYIVGLVREVSDKEAKLKKYGLKGLNKPKRTPKGPKKSAVLAKKGKDVKLVRFGDPNMTIKKHQPGRRKSFRARHRCDTAKDKFSARYWSCKAW